MARNIFTLNNNPDKIGVYSEALVNGSDGDQTVLINSSASGVEITSTVERADFALNSADVSFSFNTSTFKIEVSHNGNVIAVVNNDSLDGTKLAFKDGSVNVKLDANTAGDNVLRITGKDAATQDIPLDGSSASLAAPVDDSVKSELGGGGSSPEPEPEVPTYDLGVATDVAKIPTDGSAYNLIGKVAEISGAKNTVISGATSITVKDDVTKLTAEDAATKAVLNLASSIVAEDKLELLALKDLSGLTNPKLVVTSAPRSGATVDLRDAVTVAEADGAQGKLDAFLARTDVDYTTHKQTQPTTLTIGKFAIKDDAIAVAKTDVNLLQRATEGVTVEDTVANIGKISADLFAEVDNVYVKDSLASIASANTKLLAEIQGKVGAAGEATFVATDTTEASVTLSDEFLTLFNGSTPEKTVDVSALVEKSTLNIALTGNFKLSTSNNPFGTTTTLKDKVAVNITGSDGVNEIDLTGFKNNTVIDGNGGADKITLGDGEDTLILGNGLNLPSKPNATLTSKADDTMTVTLTKFSTTDDGIQFSGALASFTSLETKAGKASSAEIDLTGMAGKVVYMSEEESAADFSNFSSGSSGFKGLKQNESAIIVVSTTSSSKIYYVEERDSSDGITFGKDIVVEIANSTDVKLTDTVFDIA